MNNLRNGFCFLQILFLVGVMPAAAGGVAGGKVGVAFGLGLSLLTVLFAFFAAERKFLALFDSSLTLPPGLEKSLHYAIDDLEIPKPRLAIFPDSTPNALVIRGPASAGTIFLSQGLLAALSENELRSLLRLCSQKALEPSLSIRTLAGLLAVFIWNKCPAAWTREFLSHEPLTPPQDRKLDPIRAIGFLIVMPVLCQFLQLSKLRQKAILKSRLLADDWDRTQEIALLKISQATTTSGVIKNPASVFLYLVDPWSHRSLIPLN